MSNEFIRTFVCVRSGRDYVKVGDTVQGRLMPGNKHFKLAKDHPEICETFRKGSLMPINGSIWAWSIRPVEKEAAWPTTI